jgi:hypothetical protein
MAKKTNRKLGLKKETLRALDQQELAAVAGGTLYYGGINFYIVGQLGGTVSLMYNCTSL